MESPGYTNVKQALITSAEALLIDHSAIRTEEDVISTKINQHGSKREQLEFKANSLNERMKTIKASLDETWKNTTSLQYGTVVHVASLKKYSESTEEHKKDFLSFDQEFQSVGERINQLNNQFIEFGSKMSVEEKKKAELSKAVKAAIQSKQTLEKSIDAGSQRLLDTEKALSEMNINLSVTLNELQNKERLLQSTTFETKQQEENEKTAKIELQTTVEKLERDTNMLNDLIQKNEQTNLEKDHLHSNLLRMGRDSFIEVTTTVESDIEQINQEVEQSKSNMSSIQDVIVNVEPIISQTRGMMTDQQKEIVKRKAELNQIERSLESKLLENIQHQKHVESFKKDFTNISKSIEKSEEELSSKMNQFKKLSEPSQDLMNSKREYDNIVKSLNVIKESLQVKKESVDLYQKKTNENKIIVQDCIKKSSNLKSETGQYESHITEYLNIEKDIQKQIKHLEIVSKEYETRLSKAEEKLSMSLQYSESKKKLEVLAATNQKEIEKKKRELEETLRKEYEFNIQKLTLDFERDEDEAEENLRLLLISHEKERKKRADKIEQLKINAEKIKKRKAISSEEKTPKKKKKKSCSEDLDEDIFSVSSQSSDITRTFSKGEKKEKQPKPKKSKETNLSPPSSTKGRRKSQTETKPKKSDQVESTGKKSKTPLLGKASKKKTSLNNSQLSVFDFTE